MVLEKGEQVRRAKTTLGRRKMMEREPKLLEEPKKLLVLKGHATSHVSNAVLGDLYILKKPLSVKLQRKNDILPFEAGGETHLENLMRHNDTSLFALGNHTKKRPHNIILGRTFGYRILDMIEFGIANYKPIADFPVKLASSAGSMPCILFNGDDYLATEHTRKIQSLLFDIFRGPHDVEKLLLAGIDRVVSITLETPRVGAPTVIVGHHKVVLKKIAGSNLPRVELVEVGPSFHLVVRRSQFAPAAMTLEAMRIAKDPRVDGTRKNISKNELGDKLGRIHVGKQNLSGLDLARMKGLGRKRSHPLQEDRDGGDADADAVGPDVCNVGEDGAVSSGDRDYGGDAVDEQDDGDAAMEVITPSPKRQRPSVSKAS